MRIEITPTATEIHEAEVLTSLSVVADAGTDLAAGLGALGTVDAGGEHVWLDIDALRSAAAATLPEETRAEWAEGYDGMIAYATSKGWTDATGRAVRAHVERG